MIAIKLCLVLLLSYLALASVTIEEDINCEAREDPMLAYIQSKTFGRVYNMKTVNSTGEILLCGMFETTKGLIAKMSRDGTYDWGYLTSITCEVMIIDSKQENILAVLHYPNRGMEIHNYAVEDGSKNYIYEYQMTDIVSVNDGAYANDYYWFVGTHNVDECFILKMSRTRRYVYFCETGLNLQSIWFPIDNPILVGSFSTGLPVFLQLNSTTFASEIQVSLSTITSTDMWIRNRWEEDIYMTWALSSSDDSLVYLVNIDSNNTSVAWSRKYNLALKNPVFIYNSAFEDYIMIGYDSSNNKNCFVRFTTNGGIIQKVKCTAKNSYNSYEIKSISLHADSGSSIVFGGQLNSENLFYYRTGVDLGDNSCALYQSSFMSASDYSDSHGELTISTYEMAVSEYSLGRWINRTDRAVTLDETLSSTISCYPSYVAPIVRKRRFTQRFMETLPNICPGLGLDVLPDNTDYELYVTDGSSENHAIDYKQHTLTTSRIYSFWMTLGTFDVQITMTNKTDDTDSMSFTFESEFILSGYMIGIVTLIYLVFFIIAVHSVIYNDYYCLKMMVYSAQNIHLLSLLGVNLPPPLVYLVQRMSIFGFIEGVFVRYGWNANSMQIDRYYRANYETTVFIVNQVLSLVVVAFVVIIVGARVYAIKPKENKTKDILDDLHQVPRDSSTDHKIWGSVHFQNVKRVSFNIFSVMYPYLLLNSIIDLTNMTFDGKMTTTSFFMAIFALAVTLKCSLLITCLAIYNLRNFNSPYTEFMTIHDNLFSGLRIKHMIKAHVIFWSKRIAIILVVFISPYTTNHYTIVAGFLTLLVFTSLELEYRITNNKMEFLYVLLTAFPPLVTSFANLLMEGHYIEYESKLDICQLVLAVVFMTYALLIPIRMLDFYKLTPKNNEALREKMSTHGAQILTTAKDLLSSRVGDDISVSINDKYDHMYDEKRAPSKKVQPKQYFKEAESANFEEEKQSAYNRWKIKKVEENAPTKPLPHHSSSITDKPAPASNIPALFANPSNRTPTIDNHSRLGGSRLADDSDAKSSQNSIEMEDKASKNRSISRSNRKDFVLPSSSKF